MSADVGKIQEKIIEDAKTKAIFSLSEVISYYGSRERALSAMRSLVSRGYFKEGRTRHSREVVFLSVEAQHSLDQFKHALHESKDSDDLFKCPEKNFADEKMHDWNFTTTDTCETTGHNEGCMYLKTCQAYMEKKKEKLASGRGME